MSSYIKKINADEEDLMWFRRMRRSRKRGSVFGEGGGGGSGGAPTPSLTQVTFQEAGTGSALAGVGDLTPSFPVTGVQAGDIFILHASIRNPFVTINQPSGWTPIATQLDIAGVALAVHSVFYKIATGSETGNLTVTFTVDSVEVKCARIYRLRGGTVTTLISGGSIGGGTATMTIGAPTVVCTAKSMAISLIYEADNQAFLEYTGETGGDWSLATALFSTPLGADSILGIMVATMASAGTITGGSTTYSPLNATWGSYNFCLQGSNV